MIVERAQYKDAATSQQSEFFSIYLESGCEFLV
jgi:hypothetical protein